MKQTLDRVRTLIDTRVRVYCVDGEIIVGKVHSVSDEYNDVLVDVETTNRADKYKFELGKFAVAIAISDISDIEVP